MNEPAKPGAPCPVCGCEVDDSAAAEACPGCGRKHHEDCWAYAGGCGIAGCGSLRVPAGGAAGSAALLRFVDAWRIVSCVFWAAVALAPMVVPTFVDRMLRRGRSDAMDAVFDVSWGAARVAGIALVVGLALFAILQVWVRLPLFPGPAACSPALLRRLKLGGRLRWLDFYTGALGLASALALLGFTIPFIEMTRRPSLRILASNFAFSLVFTLPAGYFMAFVLRWSRRRLIFMETVAQRIRAGAARS